MHRFFIPQPYSDTMTIMGVDARHIYTVLRMQCGSRVQIVSDDGVTALAEIADANESVVTVKCLEVLAESHEPSVRIVLAQGLAKGEKMDFIIQKAVELGVSEIIPVAMEHSVVRLEGDKAVKKAERWQKIAEAAAKQSKRDIIPMVQPVQTMEQMLADNPKEYFADNARFADLCNNILYGGREVILPENLKEDRKSTRLNSSH